MEMEIELALTCRSSLSYSNTHRINEVKFVTIRLSKAPTATSSHVPNELASSLVSLICINGKSINI